MSAFDEFKALLARRGGRNYGETVTIADHSLLTAAAAEDRGMPDALVAACLLHDVGHFLDEPDDPYGSHSHDRSGGRWVAARFGPAVAEPVRLHVAAKRYLCAQDPGYHHLLSPASQHSLDHQGGPMSPSDVNVFEADPFAADAQILRRLDDGHGKRVGVAIPPLSHFRPLLTGLETSAGRP
jgi:gamma-butyrobetaine dioxygenase